LPVQLAQFLRTGRALRVDPALFVFLQQTRITGFRRRFGPQQSASGRKTQPEPERLEQFPQS